MSNYSLTGTEAERFSDIQNRWLVFEPSPKFDKYYYKLYTTQIGQNVEPEFYIVSGSVPIDSNGVLTIEKEIHVFYSDSDANEFLSAIGPENISFYKEEELIDPVGGATKKIRIGLINYPEVLLDMEFNYLDPRKGYMAEVFFSSTVASGEMYDLRPVGKEVIYNSDGDIVSDTYLRYFSIEEEK